MGVIFLRPSLLRSGLFLPVDRGGVSALKPKLKAFFVGEMDGEEDDLMSGNRSGNAYALFPI